MKTYHCGFCQKEFKQKNDYLRHLNRKTPCINMTTLTDIAMRKQQNEINMKTLKTFYSKCFNILRDNEHLTGYKALRNLSYLLILKLLEPKLNKINFRDYDEYNFNIEDNEVIEELFKLTRFSYLGESNEDNIQSKLNALWDQILSEHPKTKNIFIKKKGFDIKRKITYKKLIKEISKINFSNIEQDIQGEAYEDILKDTMTGKVLGQFFTPPIIKKLCVDLVKPKITPDGKTETIFDLAMGTGGFLLTSIKYLEKEATSKNIKLDWDFLSNEGLGGIEAEPDTFQLTKSNMLISTGRLCNNIHLGDSIRNTVEEKYDIVLANPPFGIKGLNYLGIENKNRDTYLPIKSNSAVPLFIQAIIYILKVNGRCAVVLPNGQELDSGNQDLVAAREYLMKTCDLKEVICLPAGVFTHTSIRTCIFYFVKRKECSFVLETKITYSKKTGKETKRTYKFSKSHSTKSIKFYECNPHTDFKELKADVPIEQIAGNSYSLNYNDYLEEDEKYEDTEEIKWMKLGDVFKLNGNGKTNSKSISNTGEYPFYKASCNNPSGTHKTYDFNHNEYLLIVKSGGSSKKPISRKYGIGKVFLVNGKCSANIAVFQLLQKSNNYIKYLYYYLLEIQPKIQKLAKYSTNNGNIDMKKLMKLKIPIPPLEKQQEIVEQLDFLNEECNTTATKRIAQLKRKNKIFLETQIRCGDNTIEKLGDVCEIEQGKKLTKKEMKKGIYSVIGGGKIIGSHNTYNREGNETILTRVGDLQVNYFDIKYYLTENGFSLKTNNLITNKFIYYFIKYNKDLLLKRYIGAAQKVISKTKLSNVKIPIPSFEKQQEIVSFCESNDGKIKELEEEIEFNKKLSSQILSSIFFKHSETKEDSSSEESNEDSDSSLGEESDEE